MIGRVHHNPNIEVSEYPLKQVTSLKCIDSINEEGNMEEDINNWITKYSQNIGCMYRMLKDKQVPKKAKQIIHKTTLRTIHLIGSECWTLTKRFES